MDTLRAVVAGVIGLAVGSFLNVVIHRVPIGESIVTPSSRCPRCGEALPARDNIPIVSFALLRGRCRNCSAPISVRYPLVEAVNAGLWLGATLRFGLSERAVFVALSASVLLAIAAIDLQHRRIPNVIVLPASAVAASWLLVNGAITGAWSAVVDSFLSAAGGFAILFVLAVATGGIGFGDVKLVAFIGLVTGRFGWQSFTVALLGGFVIGGIVSLALLVSGRKGRKDAIPFGPSLAAGAVIALYAGRPIADLWLRGY